MYVRFEVWPFLIVALVLAGLLWAGLRAAKVSKQTSFRAGVLLLLVLGGYLMYFFRDPARQTPLDPDAIVAGADGTVMNVVPCDEPLFLQTNSVRISIFLSLFDVHVNRAPLDGTVTFARYYPGKRYFTFQEKSSFYNQHSSLLFTNSQTRCLVQQIVGPVARRVVFWVTPGDSVRKGDPIGMMKFGSRLDVYLPAGDVRVLAKRGDKVRAGETIIARLRTDKLKP
ncbi:MAG: phosphatidylserine decarboxylase [bacterium]